MNGAPDRKETSAMHVIAFNGSPHEKGNTYAALRAVTEQLEAAGITAEIVQVGHLPIRGCAACNQCARNKDSRCVPVSYTHLRAHET